MFAWYGQAVALAQLLEAALVAYLAALPPATKRRQRSDALHNVFIENLDRKALGELRDELARFPQSKGAAARLGKLMALRVELIHHWFRRPDRAARLQSHEGRRELVAELQIVVDELGVAAAAIAALSLLTAFPPAEAPPHPDP